MKLSKVILLLLLIANLSACNFTSYENSSTPLTINQEVSGTNLPIHEFKPSNSNTLTSVFSFTPSNSEYIQLNATDLTETAIENVNQWYSFMPREGNEWKSAKSLYSDKILGEVDTQKNMVVSVLCMNKLFIQHTYFAFEWIEKINNYYVRRHQVFHFRLTSLDHNALVLSLKNLSSKGNLVRVTNRITALKGKKNVDSDPYYFFRNNTKYLVQSFQVDEENGLKSVKDANDNVGIEISFSIFPFIPGVKNCAQVTRKTLSKGGIDALSRFGAFCPAWFLSTTNKGKSLPNTTKDEWL